MKKFLALVLFSVACGSHVTTPPGVETIIVRVVDGDTVKTETETIRLIGIDTPETVHPTKPVQCYGPESSAYVKNRLPPGTPVRLESGLEERDRFQRLLAYINLNSEDLNLTLIEEGYARAETRFPHPRMTAYVAAESVAKQNNVGRWSACP